MLRWSLLLGLVPAFVFACSSGKSSSAPPGDDAGGGDDGGGGTTLTYAPASCKYTVSPPATLGYTSLALDDTGPVDPTNGVPARVRVGLGGGTTLGQAGYADPTTSAAFTWETAESNNAAKVKMGTSAGALTEVSTGYSFTLPGPGSQAGTYFHEVHVCGLTADTTYFYQVGGGPAGSEVWSATQSFTTMPSSGTITVGVFGDSRDKDTTWTTVHSRMKDAGVLMSLIDGDVVDIGSIESLYAQWLGDIWQSGSGFLTLGQQYILAINGNHENDTATSFANWALPGDGPYAETFASFNLGSAHIVMIDDEQIAVSSSSPQAQAQLQWIDQDLAAARADASHPFIVAMSHRGLFSTSEHSGDADVLTARGSLAPLFDKHKVDLVINGHDHEYESTYPLTAGTPPTGAPNVMQPGQGGTVYVICAGAGADPYSVGAPGIPYRNKQVAFGPGSANRQYIGTYALLQIAPTTLTLTAYGLKPTAPDDVIDTVTLSH